VPSRSHQRAGYAWLVSRAIGRASPPPNSISAYDRGNRRKQAGARLRRGSSSVICHTSDAGGALPNTARRPHDAVDIAYVIYNIPGRPSVGHLLTLSLCKKQVWQRLDKLPNHRRVKDGTNAI